MNDPKLPKAAGHAPRIDVELTSARGVTFTVPGPERSEAVVERPRGAFQHDGLPEVPPV